MSLLANLVKKLRFLGRSKSAMPDGEFAQPTPVHPVPATLHTTSHPREDQAARAQDAAERVPGLVFSVIQHSLERTKRDRIGYHIDERDRVLIQRCEQICGRQIDALQRLLGEFGSEVFRSGFDASAPLEARVTLICQAVDSSLPDHHLRLVAEALLRSPLTKASAINTAHYLIERYRSGLPGSSIFGLNRDTRIHAAFSPMADEVKNELANALACFDRSVLMGQYGLRSLAGSAGVLQRIRSAVAQRDARSFRDSPSYQEACDSLDAATAWSTQVAEEAIRRRLRNSSCVAPILVFDYDPFVQPSSNPKEANDEAKLCRFIDSREIVSTLVAWIGHGATGPDDFVRYFQASPFSVLPKRLTASNLLVGNLAPRGSLWELAAAKLDSGGFLCNLRWVRDRNSSAWCDA